MKNFLLLALTSLFLASVLVPTQLYSQQKTEVPTVHNKALDEKCLKFADNEEERTEITEYISNTYNTNGSYLGSAKLQQVLDVNMFYEFLDGNIEILKKFDENAYNKIDREAMKKVMEKSEPIKQWLNENYFNVYNQPFGQFDHQPDYMEFNDALDDYIEKDPYKLFENGLGVYRYDTKNFVEKLKKSNMETIQKKSNLVAFKVKTTDYILFKNLLINSGIYKDYKDVKVIENFNSYMSVISPSKNL